MIDKHKDKRKYNNFGYHSTKFWLKGNDTCIRVIQIWIVNVSLLCRDLNPVPSECQADDLPINQSSCISQNNFNEGYIFDESAQY